MSRAPISRVVLPAIAGVVVLAVASVALLSRRAPRPAGSLTATVTLTSGQEIGELAYKVTGNGAALTGQAKVAPAGTALVSVEALPVAQAYQLELSATSANGTVKCSRRVAFDVAPQRTTSLAVSLSCRDMGAITRFLAAHKAAAKANLVDVAPPVEATPECTSCERQFIASGHCEPDSGCEGLEGNDKQLCTNLLNCVRATNCWAKDPLDCLCGTTDHTVCASTDHANGDCRAEIEAAAKTTDPIASGKLFYDPTVPAGRANRLISCDKERCAAHCSLL
jgi:hypothetical protein